jgi:hypothetical protein
MVQRGALGVDRPVVLALLHWLHFSEQFFNIGEDLFSAPAQLDQSSPQRADFTREMLEFLPLNVLERLHRSALLLAHAGLVGGFSRVDGGDLPHVGDGRFLDRHAVACGAVVVHLDCGFHSRTGICEQA